ncbi:MAG TPA: hypothetical protein VNK51_28095 [Bradyrhizobium sp.]|nr:hypothetical protein [Bradyrhizobium sp.]
MKALISSLLALGLFALMFTVVTAVPINSPAYASKMDGKPGGCRNCANYSQPKAKKNKGSSGR